MYCAVALVKHFEPIQDARDENGVQMYEIDDMLLKGEGEYSADSPRKLLKELRDTEMLSEYSKGKVAVRDEGDYVTIIDKNKGHPLFVLLQMPQNRDDLPTYHKSFQRLVNDSLLQTARELEIDVSDVTSQYAEQEAESDEYLSEDDGFYGW